MVVVRRKATIPGSVITEKKLPQTRPTTTTTAAAAAPAVAVAAAAAAAAAVAAAAYNDYCNYQDDDEQYL